LTKSIKAAGSVVGPAKIAGLTDDILVDGSVAPAAADA